MIVRGRRGKGNYAYATARIKSKKSLLLTNDNYPKLLMMDLNEIGRFMGETQYKTEMAELASKYSGVDLIELGTSRNLAHTYRSIIGFCSGDLKEIVAGYLRRWDMWNIKTILRGKYSNATVEEIQEDLVPAGTLSEEDLNALLAIDSMSEILETSARKLSIQVPADITLSLERDGNLAAVEDYLDFIYYQRLLASIDPNKKSDSQFLSFVKREIDIVNLRTLLKLKMDDMAGDKIKVYFIEGGSNELSIAELNRLAGIETFDNLVDELSKYSFYDEIKNSLEKAKTTRSLNPVMVKLDKYLAKEAERFSHLYPLSVLPILDYIIRKKIEVDNIRIIARGKASGMDNEIIKKLLVI